MIVLDSSALIAYLDPTDGHHAPASELLGTRLRDAWVMSAVSLAEVMTGAARQGEDVRAEVAEAVADLQVEVLPVADEDVDELARLRSGTGLRMPDCCVLRAAEVTGGTVVTFDARLASRAAERGVDVLPRL